MKEKKLFRKNDIIVISVVVVICAALFFIPKILSKNSDSLTATVYVDGEVAYQIDLNNVVEPYTIEPNSSPKSIITVEKGRMCFSYAECKDKLCVNSGWLSSGGQTAACLPARVVITVKSGEKSPDMITY